MDGVFSMKKRFLLWTVLVMFTALCLGAVQTLWTQRTLAEKTVRLHVVANSDSESDQAQKLRVRDTVVQTVAELTTGCTNAQQAREVIEKNLPLIREAAEKTLRAEHSDYAVRVHLGREKFQTRYYDSFTLPAGEYPALRVSIGRAQGHNWWCVVFPSLCTAATSDELESCARTGGFDEDETELIRGGEERYELRFKCFEWLQALLNRLK